MKPIIANYELFDCIGSGAFGKVYRACNTTTGKLCAVKCIPHNKLTSRALIYLDREVSILRSVSHENVVELFDVVSTLQGKYLVFEHCNGGDLLGFVRKNGGRLCESLAQNIVSQLVRGMNVLNELSLIHRDIKLSNVFLDFPTKESRTHNRPVVKLGDLGLARELSVGDMIVEPETALEMSCVGTPFSMAPEIRHNLPYSFQADIWSLGIVAYELLCGAHCFSGNTNTELNKSMDEGIYKIPKELNLSKTCLDFISLCLVQNPKERLKWEGVLEHPFISGICRVPPEKSIKEEGKYYVFNSKRPKSNQNHRKFSINSQDIDYEIIKEEETGEEAIDSSFVVL